MISSPVNNDFLPTGIRGFDTILGGGLPANRLYLIQGLAGSGKTTLACQVGFLQAQQGKKVLILTLIAESHAKLLQHLSNFSFYNEGLIGKEILFHSAYNALSHGGLKTLLNFISSSLNETGAEILIIDGFRSVRDSRQSDLSLPEFMHALNSLVSTMGCTAFLLSPVEGNAPYAENTLVDGLIELSQYTNGMRLVRELKVFKIRGSNHMLGSHVFEVTEEGVVTYPRLEAIGTSSSAISEAQESQVSFGIPSWDHLTGGGVVRGTITNLIGSPGIGKTLLGLHFIHDGLKNGEQCLILSFHEAPPRLVKSAKGIGLDFVSHLQRGNLEVMWKLPLEVLIDSLAVSLLENIDRRKVTRLFIDGIEGFINTAMHGERARPFLVALVNELRFRNVTTFFTQELPYYTESFSMSDPSTAASALFENIMLMRYIELNGLNYRRISVMKMRDHDYDPGHHILSISDQGIRIDCPVAALLEHKADAQGLPKKLVAE